MTQKKGLKKMKILRNVMMVAIVVMLFMACSYIESHDKVKAEVTEVNGYEVMVVDARGQECGFFTEEKNEVKVGDEIIVTYNNMMTLNDLTDDEIVDYKKAD